MQHKRDSKTAFQSDYLIIGAGPAGLQMGYFLEKAGRDYLILEIGDTPGSFFKRFPRHRKLISINKVYTRYDDSEVNLRWDWNSLLSDSSEMLVKNYTKDYFPPADVMVQYLGDFANHFKLKVRYGTKVIRIEKDELFKVSDDQGHTYTCKYLIVATGVTKPYIPSVPGIELAEQYSEVSVEPGDFVNQRVLIIGKGNSGFETADNLVSTAAVIHLASPSPISMAWETHFVGNLRAVNNNVLDTYQLKSQNALLDATIKNIERRGEGFAVKVSYSHAQGEQEELYYDRVIACTGFRFDDAIFGESCRPALAVNGRFPQQTSEWQSVNVERLYFAGTLMQMRDYGKTTSGFIHGFRYNILALRHMLESKYENCHWPRYPVVATAEGLRDAVIRRVNKTSALWQQFGFLCDLIMVDKSGEQAQYVEEIPVDYVHDSDFGQSPHYYTVTLEYGDAHMFENPFNITRDIQNAARSSFLHPIIRRFCQHTLISEHHIMEDLAAEWLEDVHIKPLQKYFHDQIEKTVGAASLIA